MFKKILLALSLLAVAPTAFAKSGAFCSPTALPYIFNCEHKDFTGKGATLADIYAKGWHVVTSYVGMNNQKQSVYFLIIEKE